MFGNSYHFCFSEFLLGLSPVCKGRFCIREGPHPPPLRTFYQVAEVQNDAIFGKAVN